MRKEEVFAKEMASGATIKDSMLRAGYAPSTARLGMQRVSKKMLKALSVEGCKLAEFGKSLSLETLKNIAIGRLATNAINGKDGGVMSAKVLGSHRELNLWTPEQMAGIVVINAPTQVAENKAKLLAEDSQE